MKGWFIGRLRIRQWLKPSPDIANRLKSVSRISHRFKPVADTGNAFAWLEQIQLCCPFDGRPASIDVEFTVDALGMCADSAQGDHEFMGDLRPRKLGFEQAEHFKLTLA